MFPALIYDLIYFTGFSTFLDLFNEVKSECEA
jgi:hypothetical protein